MLTHIECGRIVGRLRVGMVKEWRKDCIIAYWRRRKESTRIER